MVKKALQEYAEHKTGLLATPSLINAAFVPYTAVLPAEDRRREAAQIDSMLSSAEAGNLQPGLAEQYKLIREGLLSEDETAMQLCLLVAGIPERKHYTGIGDRPNPGNYITVICCLQHPFSRGDVHIKSSDPTVYPAANPRYLSHPLDVRIFAKHLLQIPKIFTTDPLASRLKDHGMALRPGCPVLTEENIEAS